MPHDLLHGPHSLQVLTRQFRGGPASREKLDRIRADKATSISLTVVLLGLVLPGLSQLPPAQLLGEGGGQALLPTRIVRLHQLVVKLLLVQYLLFGLLTTDNHRSAWSRATDH